MFKFYIVDAFDGEVYGTNDEDKARQSAESEDFFVIWPENNVLITTLADSEIKEM